MKEAGDRRSRLIGWAQFGLLGAVLAVGIYFARAPTLPSGDQGSIRNAQPPAVRVLKPVAGSHVLTVNLTGEVRPQVPVALVPQAVGRIVEVSPSLRTGGRFRAGETLLVIDSTDAELRLESARGLHAAALGRVRRHREQGALEAAEWAQRNPGQPVPDIVARLPQVERFEGRARAALAGVRLAERELAETRYSLPFDGIVIAATATVGQMVAGGASSGLGMAFETGKLETSASIAVDDLAYLGDPLGLAASVWAGGRRFDAVVSAVAPVLAPRTRLATLVFDFAEATEGVELPMPGTFARISLRGPAFEDVFSLPESAHRADGRTWIVQDGKLRSATPRTLARTDAGWITAAFDVGEGVVLGAVPGERPGLAVTAVDAEQ